MDALTGLELVKLLLQVAWADNVVTPPERDALFAVADRLAGPPGRALLTSVLDERQPLPPPNVGVLARHRGEVLAEVARLCAVDGVDAEELELVAIIGGMLR